MKEEIAQLKQEKETAEREAAAAKIAAEKERAEEAVARKKKEAAAEEERKAVEGPLKDGSELEVAPPSMHDYADNTLDSKSEELVCDPSNLIQLDWQVDWNCENDHMSHKLQRSFKNVHKGLNYQVPPNQWAMTVGQFKHFMRVTLHLARDNCPSICI